MRVPPARVLGATMCPTFSAKPMNLPRPSVDSGGEQESKLIICSCVKEKTRGDATAWRRIIEDLDGLAEGVVAGNVVAQEGRRRWRGVLLLTKSDEEVRSNEFGLAHFNNPRGPCSDCCGDDSTRPWTDLSGPANWRATEEMTLEFWASRIRSPLHPLVASHYCCSRFFLAGFNALR